MFPLVSAGTVSSESGILSPRSGLSLRLSGNREVQTQRNSLAHACVLPTRHELSERFLHRTDKVCTMILMMQSISTYLRRFTGLLLLAALLSSVLSCTEIDCWSLVDSSHSTSSASIHVDSSDSAGCYRQPHHDCLCSCHMPVIAATRFGLERQRVSRDLVTAFFESEVFSFSQVSYPPPKA